MALAKKQQTHQRIGIEREDELLKSKEMKRVNNLYAKIYDMDNLLLADEKARKGKQNSYGVQLHDRNKDENLKTLQNKLKNLAYETSEYSVFTITTPKERLIYRLPFFPDRIMHHAIMNLLEPILVSVFTRDSYACIKGRGVHDGVRRLKKDLAMDIPGTKYCLKLDIKKFYPSIDHEIMLSIIGRKIKDKELMLLLKEIVKSAPGLPIGNYLSQYFANLYLTYMDHFIKEELKVKYYHRYADDMVLLSGSKDELWSYFEKIQIYLNEKLKLEVKEDYQVFPVQKRGIDFIGYVFFHTHTLLRKSIKQSFARAVKKNKPKEVLASYYGWAKHCNSKNLLKKLNYEI